MFVSQEKRVNDKVSDSKFLLCWPVLVGVYMGLPWQQNFATKWKQSLKVVKNVLGGWIKQNKTPSNSPSKKKQVIMVGMI